MTGSPDEVRNDRRVQEVYTGTGTPPATERAAGVAKENRVLRFEKVNAFYGESHILNDASLDCARRRNRSVVGPKRCRKIDIAQGTLRACGSGIGHH